MTISERIAELREYARQDSERFTVGQPLSYSHQNASDCGRSPFLAVVFFLLHLLMRAVPCRRARLAYPGAGTFLEVPDRDSSYPLKVLLPHARHGYPG